MAVAGSSETTEGHGVISHQMLISTATTCKTSGNAHTYTFVPVFNQTLCHKNM